MNIDLLESWIRYCCTLAINMNRFPCREQTSRGRGWMQNTIPPYPHTPYSKARRPNNPNQTKQKTHSNPQAKTHSKQTHGCAVDGGRDRAMLYIKSTEHICWNSLNVLPHRPTYSGSRSEIQKSKTPKTRELHRVRPQLIGVRVGTTYYTVHTAFGFSFSWLRVLVGCHP